MLIDWYTVGAQVINFLILVWLLKRFLYRPILDAIRAREQRIAAQLADAAEKQAAANRERDQFNQRNAEFEAQRAALFGKVSEEAKAERQRQLEQTRTEADALRSRLQDALRSDQQALSAEISRRTRQEVFAIARKTLAELATTSLEECMTRVFIERIRSLSAEDKTLLASVIEAAAAAAIVRSAFELAAQQRSAIERAVGEVCGAAPRLSYEVVPGLIGGVELSASGRKLAWSIADYLDLLETSIAEILPPSLPAALPDPAPAAMPVAVAADEASGPVLPAALAAGSG